MLLDAVDAVVVVVVHPLRIRHTWVDCFLDWHITLRGCVDERLASSCTVPSVLGGRK
jgi:hypothetical protein